MDNNTDLKVHENSAFPYEVTLLILTYNPDWKKLQETVLSGACQEGVRMEIVIADDGSKENCRTALEALFRSIGFSDYQLIMNECNQGTIANYISGLRAALGEYTKTISPGDFLTGPTVLRDWKNFMRHECCDWSFSNALYYQNEPTGMRLLPTPPFPVYLAPYRRRDINRCRWNYAVLDDAALGAAIMGKTALELKYALELAQIGNKYCEDYSFRMMMYDGAWGGYYPADTIFYEYGSGISSGGSQPWQKRIEDEFLRMSQSLSERKNPDPFQKTMIRQIRKKTSMCAMVRIPGKIRRALLFKFLRRKPKLDFDATKNWLQRICESVPPKSTPAI